MIDSSSYRLLYGVFSRYYKFILMRLRSLLIVFFILCSSLLFAQTALELGSAKFYPDKESPPDEALFVFEGGIDSGILAGMLGEWVYYDKNLNNSFDFVESRLDWQLSPLFFYGFSGSIRIVPRFFVGFGGWLGIPSLLGSMEDRDWHIAAGDYWSFSHHDNFLQDAQFFDINTGYSLIYEKNLILNLLTGFNYKRMHMSAQNGYAEQPPGTSPPWTFSSEVLNYEINFFTPYVGTEVGWRPASFFTLDAALSISPFLTFVYDRDFHVQTGNYYLDFPRFGFTLTATIDISFHFADFLALHIKNSLMWTPPLKGPTYIIYNGDNFFTTNPSSRGGASLILYSLTLSLLFSI